MSVRVKDFDVGDLIHVLEHLTTTAREVIAGRRKLEPWLADLEAALAALRSVAGGLVRPRPEGEPPPVPGPLLDKRAEAAVRVLVFVLLALENFHIANGRDDDAARVRAAREFIFADGLAFLNAAYASQTGSTRRVVALAEDPGIAPVVSGISFFGQTWAQLLALVTLTNQALIDYIMPKPVDDEKEPSVAGVRVRTISMLCDFLSVVDNDLPEKDASPTRRQILGAVEQRAEALRLAESRGSAPAEPPEPTGTVVPA